MKIVLVRNFAILIMTLLFIGLFSCHPRTLKIVDKVHDQTHEEGKIKSTDDTGIHQVDLDKEKTEDMAITHVQVPIETESNSWQHIGHTKDGTSVFIERKTIFYPSKAIVSVWAKTLVKEKTFVDLLELDCSQSTFRILAEGTTKKPPWSSISMDSPSELIYHALCNK